MNLSNRKTIIVAALFLFTGLPVALIAAAVSEAPLLVGWMRPTATQTATSTPPADELMNSSDPWLILQNLPDDATQVEKGAEVYRLVCRDCHGDHGQGLTPDWIAQWDPESQNCWQAKCHASTHPIDGFTLPHNIPPVTGEVMGLRFPTAMDLFIFVKGAMPWYDPGNLPDEQYWMVCAFLLKLNGIDLGDTVLGPDNAATISMRNTN